MPRKHERAHQLEHGNSLLEITRLEGPWVVCCSDFVVNLPHIHLGGVVFQPSLLPAEGNPHRQHGHQQGGCLDLHVLAPQDPEEVIDKDEGPVHHGEHAIEDAEDQGRHATPVELGGAMP